MKSETLALFTTAAAAAFLPMATCISKPPPRPAGKPTKLDPEAFPWTDPFAPGGLEGAGLAPTCEAGRTFRGSEFRLDDLSLPPPKGLLPYADALRRALRDKPYPGSWDGVDPHGYGRVLVRMDYPDVPRRVRAWIEAQEADGLFSVFERGDGAEAAEETAKPPETARKPGEDDPADKDKIVLFAPGAIYRALPLWVAEGSDCEGKEYLLSPQSGLNNR